MQAELVRRRLTETGVFAARAARQFWRNRPLVVSALAFPLLLLFIQVATFGRVVGAADHVSYVQRFAPLMVLVTATGAASGSAVAFYLDVHGGLLERLRTMPVAPGSVLAGRVLGDLARIVAVAAVTAAVAYVPGFRFERGVLDVLAFFGVVALFGVMVASAAIAIALTARTLEGIRIALGTPTTLLFFLSVGFVPASAFPGFLRPFVEVNPLSIVTRTLIGLSSSGSAGPPIGWTLAWTLGASAFCFVVALRRYASVAATPV